MNFYLNCRKKLIQLIKLRLELAENETKTIYY
jgi:hypothetical protein